MTLQIGILEGDDIGLEVVPETIKVMKAAAQKCGLSTGFVLRPGEHGPGQTRDLKAEGDWNEVGTSMIDLAKKLGC
jgi:hypothetical protein